MDTIRRDFIKSLEKEIKTNVLDIEWVYGKGEAISDGEDSPIFYCECALQVTIEEYGLKEYLIITGESYCEDPDNIAGSILDSFEYIGYNFTSGFNNDYIVELLWDYFTEYAESAEKPAGDWVYYESF